MKSLLSGAELRIYSFLLSIFSVLTGHHKVCKAQSTTAVGMVDDMRPAILPVLAHARHHIVQLISNISEKLIVTHGPYNV